MYDRAVGEVEKNFAGSLLFTIDLSRTTWREIRSRNSTNWPLAGKTAATAGR